MHLPEILVPLNIEKADLGVYTYDRNRKQVLIPRLEIIQSDDRRIVSLLSKRTTTADFSALLEI